MNISVLVCTYNSSKFLVDALECLAAQTFPEFELLIVDDGSEDDTEETVHKFAPNFRNCRYLKKPHTGIADSRNFGMKAATGTYVAFLEADDIWAPKYLETISAAILETPEAELICTSGLNIYASGEIISPFFASGLSPVNGPLNASREFLALYPCINVSATTLKKSAWERVGQFNTTYASGDDMDWFSRAVLANIHCVRLDQRLVLYRIHGGNLTGFADRIFLAWSRVYREVWNGKVSDPVIAAYLRNQTRKPFLSLLPRYSASHNRMLLRNAIESLGGDSLLEATYYLTYLGLCPVAKVGRWVKRTIKRLAPSKGHLDLHTPLDTLFAKVAGNAS